MFSVVQSSWLDDLWAAAGVKQGGGSEKDGQDRRDGSPDLPPDPDDPEMTDAERMEAAAEKRSVDRFVAAALQGTASLFKDPAEAARQANEVALATEEWLEANSTPFLLVIGLVEKLVDTIQVTAGQEKNPKKAAEAAGKIALAAVQDQHRAKEKINWRAAHLPQAQAHDCTPVRGKLPGPKRYQLCTAHDHVIDVTVGMVVAHNAEEYKTMLKAGDLPAD